MGATTYIGLLRAVNLGPHNKVGMADLRACLEDLGLANVRTLLQSGNVVFETAARPASALEKDLERAVAARLGLETDIFVRSAAEWRRVIAGNPFLDAARRDPGHLVVMVLRRPPTASAVRALQDAITGREEVRAGERHVYIVYPDGIGRSRLTNAVIEKALGTRGTARNWNTVTKLAELAGIRE